MSDREKAAFFAGWSVCMLAQGNKQVGTIRLANELFGERDVVALVNEVTNEFLPILDRVGERVGMKPIFPQTQN